jgi:hypothetical protein
MKTTMSRARTPGGRIFVEKTEKLEEMLEEDSGSRMLSPSSRSGRYSRRGQRDRVTSAETSQNFKKTKARELLQKEYALVEAQSKANVEKAVQHKVDKKNRTFATLSHDIERCQNFLDSVDKSLSLHDEAARNKTRRQFEDWNTVVHAKIQSDISAQLEAKPYKDLNKEKNRDYQNFLNITNKKAAIFRDIIIESEYDPLEPNRRAIKSKPGKLNDPTLHILQKTIDENSMLDPDFAKKSRKIGGKDTLPTEMWASGKIEATPHGRFGKMMAAAGKEQNKFQKSKVVFDDYDFPTGKAAIDREMPLGKRPCDNPASKGSFVISHK